MAGSLPPSPSSGISGGSEWNMVARRNIKSSLLLLVLLSAAVFALSVLYSSSSRSLPVAMAGVVDDAHTSQQRKMPDVQTAGLDVSRPAPADDEDDDEPTDPPHTSMPTPGSAVAAVVPAPSPAETTVGMTLEAERCDISMGKWVRDPRGPVYTNLTCPTMPELKNCQKHGKDPGHLYWRWQPDGCDLPRFSPERFLDVVRGKQLAFIGDSLARNQMESLLCLLSQVETPTDVYSDEFDKFRTWHFAAHNFTLMVMWTEFYGAHAVPVVDADGKTTPSFDIHLDRLSTSWTSRLSELDYAVISGGNWFFRVNYLWEGGRRVGCVNCREANLTDFGIPYAVRRVARAALDGIARCRRCKGSLATFLRTYTPDHFEHGSWFTGGYCNRTEPLDEREVSIESIGWELRKVQNKEVRRVRKKKTTTSGGKRFVVLDVTKAMMLRADGHPGGLWDRRLVGNVNDCLHWCLPGPVDMWNVVLLQRLAGIRPPQVVR